MKKLKPANLLLEKHLKELGLDFVREYRFCAERKWRFDYVLTHARDSIGTAIEIEGGIYSQGRHTRGKGYEADMDKYNEGTMIGWRVLRFSTGQVLRGEAKAFLERWVR